MIYKFDYIRREQQIKYIPKNKLSELSLFYKFSIFSVCFKYFIFFKIPVFSKYFRYFPAYFCQSDSDAQKVRRVFFPFLCLQARISLLFFWIYIFSILVFQKFLETSPKKVLAEAEVTELFCYFIGGVGERCLFKVFEVFAGMPISTNF